MIKCCSKIGMTGTSAAVALMLSHPATAQDDDIVEASAPKGEVEEAGAVSEGDEVTLDRDSWHSLQCMVMLYLTIDDAESKPTDQSTEGLYLNIGYHLGQFNARTPDSSPADLIEAVIAQTFADQDAFKATAKMCEATAGSIADQTAAIADRLSSEGESEGATAEPTQVP